ncbi:hypothetical protein U1Q18_032794 [Sarracenia purpurea var. burkii]
MTSSNRFSVLGSVETEEENNVDVNQTLKSSGLEESGEAKHGFFVAFVPRLPLGLEATKQSEALLHSIVLAQGVEEKSDNVIEVGKAMLKLASSSA